MPYEGLGLRHQALATKVCQHGQIVVEDNFVGPAFKALQLTPFINPLSTDEEGRLLSQQIAVGEEFEIQIGGVHEVPLVGEIEDLQIGDPVYIRMADNALMAGASSGGTDEVQVITLTSATGGTYTASFEGDVTAPIAFNATAKAVEEALVALLDIEVGDVGVVGGAGGPYTVTFKGRYADENVPAIVVNGAALVGGGAKVVVTTSSEGAAGVGSFPVGVITEIDVSREPAFARVNANNWQAFLQGALG